MSKCTMLLMTGFCLLFTGIAAAGNGIDALPPGGEAFGLKGEVLEKGGYKLTVVPSVAVEDGLLISSHPGGTLLAAVIDPEFAATGMGRGIASSVKARNPLVYVETSLPLSLPVLVLPEEDFLEDELIRIELITPSGRGMSIEAVLAEGRVNMERFAFTTTPNYDDDGVLQSYTHCCSGGTCGQMCIDCDDICFECDIAECNIECRECKFRKPKVKDIADPLPDQRD